MATLTPVQVAILNAVVDEAVTSRRRGAAKSTRPEFKAVFDREISELLQLKPLLEKLNGEGAGKGR